MKSPPRPTIEVEPLLTFHQAAYALGIPYFKLQRAARNGSLPTYSLHNSRKYVKLSDILARLSASRA